MINKLPTEKIIPDCLDVPGQSMANRARSFWPNSTIYLKKKLKIATCNSTRIETNSKILNLNEYKDTNPRMNENSKKTTCETIKPAGVSYTDPIRVANSSTLRTTSSHRVARSPWSSFCRETGGPTELAPATGWVDHYCNDWTSNWDVWCTHDVPMMYPWC